MAPLWQFHVPPPPIVTERRLGLLELSGCSGTTKTQNDAVARTHANQENLMNYLAEHQNSECTTALGLTPAMYPSQSHPLPGTESLYSAPFLETCISPSVVLKASYEAPRSSSPAKLDKSLCARSSPANHVASELKPDGEDPAWVPFCSYPGRESQTDEVSLGHMDSLSAVAETLPLSRRTQLPEPRFVTAPSPSRIQSGIASDTHLDVVMQLCPPTDTPKHSISALNVVVIPDSAPSPVRDVMGSTGPVAPPLTTISSQNHLRSDKREETEPAHHRVVLIYEHTQLSPTCIGMAKTSLPLVIEKIGGSRHASQNQKADEKLDGRSLRLEKTLKRMRLSPRVFDISRLDAHTAKNKELADTQPVNQFGIALPYLSENDEDLVSFTRRSRILPLETSVKQSAAEEFLQDEVTPKNAPLISKSRSKRLFADATFPSGSCSSHSGDDVVNDSMDDASCSDSSSPRLKIPAKSTGGTIYMRENVDAILSPLLSSRRSHAVRDSDSDDIECHKILTSPLRTCSHCHKSLSTQWHAVGDGTELCAQCYQYFAKHGSFDGCPSSGSKPTRVKDFTFLKKKRAVQGLCHAKESTTAVKKRDQTQKPMKSSKLSITSSPVIRKVVSPTLGLDSTEKRRYVQYKDTSESSSSSENDDACDRDYQPTQQKTKSGLSKVERKRRRVSIHTSGVNTERVKKKPLPIAEMKQATVEPSRSSFKKNDLVWALDLESKHFRQAIVNSVQENATAFVQFLYGGAHLSSEEFCIETTSLHHLELEIGHRVFVEESCGPMKNSKKTHTKRSIVVEIVERLREQTFRVRSIDSLHRRGNKSENLGLVTAGMMFLDHELIESNLRGRLSKETKLTPIFEGIKVIASFNSNEGPDSESRILDGETEIIVRQFQERGGTFHFAHEFSLTRLALREEKTFVLAKAVSKSQLFLASLAFSRPVISYAWLRDCILKNSLQDPMIYQLPNGMSKETEQMTVYLRPSGAPPIFQGLKFSVTGSVAFKGQWEDLVRMAGGDIREDAPVDYVLLECMPERTRIRNAIRDGPTFVPCISKVWIEQCLVNQRLVQLSKEYQW